MHMCRVLTVVLGLVAASARAYGSLSLEKDVTWFTSSQAFERAAWSAVEPPKVCALDIFRFGLNFPVVGGLQYKDQDAFQWQLVATKVEGWENGAIVASGPLQVKFSGPVYEEEDKEEVGEEEEQRGFRCEFDAGFCVPKLVGIQLPDVDTENDNGASLQKAHSIVLQFEQPTNRPAASSKEEIDGFVTFTEYIGAELEGVWSDEGRVLTIRIVDIDVEQVKPVGELMQGLLDTSIIVARVNGGAVDEVVYYEGVESLRVEPPGAFTIRVSVAGEVAYWSPEVFIEPCDSAYIVMDPSRTLTDTATASGSTDEIVRSTAPSFAIHGVLTHGGDEAFVLPHESIQMETLGSWSLSLWVFLTEDSTGDFRTLFFNGDGEGQQRTPSAWWKPDERRLVLRVSTNASADVGLDSDEELPLNRWVHVGFTFVNCSQAAASGMARVPTACPRNLTAADSWSYSYSFYVNGLLDTEVRIREPVVANAGPLHVGKGPWTDGMQGFVSDLKVFSVPVDADEHRRVYFSERHVHENYADCRLGTRSLAAVNTPATQIAYLSQCLKFGAGDNGDPALQDGLDLDDPGNFEGLQAAAIEQSMTARDACAPDAWDLLKEAADLGHPAACRDVGEAYLYGAYQTEDHCPAPPPVKQNLSLAGTYLMKALEDDGSAGKALAILVAMSGNDTFSEGGQLDLLTLGLVHFAAASGEKDAFAMLGRRYHHAGASDAEVANYHFYQAAAQAANDFHQLGKQPLHEMVRLYDSLERDITVGERGDDDELIQFQKMQADKGDVGAMAAMGDLYYWGAHGVPRDHTQAYNYFNRAAQAGNVDSQSAVAGMLLKGEGTAQDNATAIEWYEKAAEKNHTRALNGLGFIHFHGSGGVQENKSLALEYFERAAENEEDGDSVFNAGYCHANGLGTEPNVTRAMVFYDVAARKFGHFDAIFEMGKILMSGVAGGVPRDSKRALEYLKAASDGGQWGSAMRRGFDLFTNDEFERAAVLYHQARELGYPVATSNLAFLYDQRLLQRGNVASERRALKHLLLANVENGDKEPLVRIGDYHYFGMAGLAQNAKAAIRWYSRASAQGVAEGAYNVGHMYEFGDGVTANLERAQRYYDRVLELSTGATEIQLAIRFALARLKLREWLKGTPLEALIGRESPLASGNGTSTSSSDVIATGFFHDQVYALVSTTAIILVVGVWYLHSNRQ